MRMATVTEAADRPTGFPGRSSPSAFLGPLYGFKENSVLVVKSRIAVLGAQGAPKRHS